MEMNEKTPMQDALEMKTAFAKDNGVDVNMVSLEDNHFVIKSHLDAEGETNPSEDVQNMKMEIAKENDLDARMLDWDGTQWTVNLGDEKMSLESYNETHSVNNKDVN